MMHKCGGRCEDEEHNHEDEVLVRVNEVAGVGKKKERRGFVYTLDIL